MEIWSHLRSMEPRLYQNSEESKGPNKSELTDDLFNNKVSNQKGNPSAKIQLSNTGKHLIQGLYARVDSLLSEHRQLKEALDKVDIEGHDARKLRSYLQWKGLERSEEISEGEKAYVEVENLQLDEPIQEAFAEFEQARIHFQQEQKKASPGYYYWAFPETYSFN